ncbi:MAG TPA: VWA domain-containing protein [Candidatus Nanoarchaeia archaeon]|nr:VWA domain-containing protein [Candidatus Nanoarchaeia archaeon]
MVYGSAEVVIPELSKGEELEGSLKFSGADDKLMHAVLENDKETIDKGSLIEGALNQGIAAFTPEIMFEQLVKNYRQAEQIYGEKLLRQISGYDPEYIERNIRIPEFKNVLKDRLAERAKKLKKEGLLDDGYAFTEKAIALASLVMYAEELDNLAPKGISGERIYQKHSHYGEKGDTRSFRKGDRYKDIAVRASIKKAIRRGHGVISKDDLATAQRQSKGHVYVIYALDASGSMKGKKIGACKKAGIALAIKAIDERDHVGLIVFGEEIVAAIPPTRDFNMLLRQIVTARAARQTDIALTIRKAIELFPTENATKHLILLTDAMPTAGKSPIKDTLDAVSQACAAGITLSVIGIGLDEKGEEVAERMTEISRGRLYTLKDTEGISAVVLEDYYAQKGEF